MNLIDFKIAFYIVTGESTSDHLEILCYPIFFMDRSFWKRGAISDIRNYSDVEKIPLCTVIIKNSLTVNIFHEINPVG